MSTSDQYWDTFVNFCITFMTILMITDGKVHIVNAMAHSASNFLRNQN